MRNIIRLLKMASPFRRGMLLAGLLALLTITGAAGLMMTSAFLIAMAALHPSIAELQIGIVGVRFFGISRGIFRYLERLVSHEATFRLLAGLRVWFYERLEPLAPARLLYYRSADLLTRIIGDIEVLEHLYIRVAGPIAIAILTPFFYSWILWFIHPGLIIPFLLPYLLSGFILPWLFYYLSKILNQKETALQTQVQIRSIDLLQGFAELKIHGCLDEYQRELLDAQTRLTSIKSWLARLASFQENMIGFGLNAAVLGQILIAVPLLRNGELSGVQLTVVVLGTMAVFEAVLSMPGAFTHFRANILSAGRLFEIIDTPTPPATKAEVFIEPVQQLCFEQVTFRYADNQNPALDNFSFTLQKGQDLYILGHSGAGKSTIINLLMRFWVPETGHISLNSRDISGISAQNLTSRIGIMSQRPYLFSATIRQNLELASLDGTAMENLIQACHMAGIGQKIESLPKKYETWTGEQGQHFSAGEQQRLALAMILLRKPEILILDEATSALDAETEHFVLKRLRADNPHRIIIFITHKINLIPADGKVLILHHGQTIEQGVFAELRQNPDSVLNRMYTNQQQDEIIN